MNPAYFQARRACVHQRHRDVWWIWWLQRYSNDLYWWWETPARRTRDWCRERAVASYYERIRPPISKRREQLIMQRIESMFPPLEWWKRGAK